MSQEVEFDTDQKSQQLTAVQEFISAELVDLGVEQDAISADARIDELDIDSLDVADLMTSIKRDYGVDIPRRDLVGITSASSSSASSPNGRGRRGASASSDAGRPPRLGRSSSSLRRGRPANLGGRNGDTRCSDCSRAGSTSSRASSTTSPSPGTSPQPCNARARRWCSPRSAGRCASPARSAGLLPRPAEVLELDVTDDADFQSLADEVGRWDRLDGVLHSVAYAPEDALGKGFVTTPAASALEGFRASAYSLQQLACALAPALRACRARRFGGRDDRRHRPGAARL